jgi:hypothetical protein
MFFCNTSVKNEKSIKIPINQNLFVTMKKEKSKDEYSLNQNFFDPSKSSPPNDFIKKLKIRMRTYNYFVDNKDDNFVNE